MIAWLVVALTAIALLPVLVRPEKLRASAYGPIVIAIGAVLLPLASAITGVATAMEHSQDTRFCLSCHEMEPYGKSLTVDDSEYIPATHVQRGLVPQERACYTCHADYAMFGTIKAKLNGLNHVRVHYLGTIPERPALYEPYKNANCLHCHEGTRAFLAAKQHARIDGGFSGLRANAVSCVKGGCHDVIHAVDTLADVEQWVPADARSPGEQP